MRAALKSTVADEADSLSISSESLSDGDFRREQALRIEAETLNAVARDLTAELDLQALLQKVTDAGTRLTLAQFGAFFYNTINEDGEAYLLYTLSGAPREAFEHFGMPRSTALFAPTFRGEGVIRIDDVTQDIRFGQNAPHHGMPKGHLPVRSYLAVPVIARSGDVLGGLFFGHPQVSVFTERAERLALGLAAQAAVAIDNARLYGQARMEIEERQRMEAALRASEQRYRQLVERLPAAIYSCDAEGRISLFNEAAVALWGREPKIGDDLWCGSHRILRLDGSVLPLDEYPLAVYLREGRVIGGEELIIERPDGTRRNVLHHPEPVRDSSGAIVGAINMLVDITDRKRADEAHARLAAIIESSSDAIISNTLDGQITTWNGGAERIFGYTADEAIGQPINLLIPADRQSEEQEITQRLRCGERIEHFETVRRRKDGRQIDVSLAVSPIRDHTGQTVAASKVARDVTARKQVEAALHESEERFRTLSMNAPVAIYIKDLEGRYTLANPLACEALGHPEGVIGRMDRELMCAAAAEELRRNDDEVVRTGRAVEREETVDRDGYRASFLSVKFPLLDKGGQAVGVGGVSTDITERKKADAALKEIRKQLQLVTDVMPLAVTRCSADMRYLWVSPGCAAWLQRPAEEIIGRPIVEVLGESALAAIRPYIDRALSGERAEFEATVDYAGIGKRWVKTVYVPTFDESGTPDGWVAVIIDLTEEKRREEALRTSEQLYRAIGESIDHGVWICDPAGQNIYVSESFLKLVGMTQEECAESGWSGVLHPDDVERTMEAWNECVRTGGTWDREHRFRGADGQWHPVLARGVPVRNDRGEITAWAGINLDISRLKQVENELREADRRKDEFLAVLSHELRNPLAPICTGLELMRLTVDDDVAAEEIRAMMVRQTKHMVRLIDDLLDVSRITRGTVELRICRAELASIITGAVETTRPIIDEFEHCLTVSLPQEPIVLDVDPARLSQVIANLLNNAAKYTKCGGDIQLSAERQGGEIIVAVKDSGVGITPEMQDHVFDMFTQVDRSAERSHGGLGIGLTLVKRLVEMHGGTVTVHSEGIGKGSEFAIRLPIVVSAPNGAGPNEGNCGNDRTPPRRILVVDDNENAARMMGMLLQALGNDVRTAFDGLAALDLVVEFQPDIVFLDIGMPKLDGYETARRIRELPWGKQAFLAALTGWGQDEDKRRTTAAGFDLHLVKPVEVAAIQEILARLGASITRDSSETPSPATCH